MRKQLHIKTKMLRLWILPVWKSVLNLELLYTAEIDWKLNIITINKNGEKTTTAIILPPFHLNYLLTVWPISQRSKFN